jgi:hypothetical protein
MTFKYVVAYINNLLYTKTNPYFLHINGSGGGCEG